MSLSNFSVDRSKENEATCCFGCTQENISFNKGGRTGLAGLVLAGPLF